MHIDDQCGALALIRLLLGCGEPGHPHLCEYYHSLSVVNLATLNCVNTTIL